MKFGKVYKKQMVPEWTETYIDYNGLKRILHVILRYQHSKQSPTAFRALQRKFSCYTFSSEIDLHSSYQPSNGDIEDQVVSIYTEQEDPIKDSLKTRFSSYPEGDAEITFFRKLDEDCHKVNAFYKDKVEEVMNEAALLNKQMDALVAMRRKVVNPDFTQSSQETLDSTDVVTIMPIQRIARTPGSEQMDRVEIEDSSDTQNVVQDTELTIGIKGTNSCQIEECNEDRNFNPMRLTNSGGNSGRQTSIHLCKQNSGILRNVKFNNPPECPIPTIKAIFNDSKERELRFRKHELRKAEDQLRLVFIEFYQKLCLLKHYSYMNLLAFTKIMKKYEKITSKTAASLYMNNSSLASSDEVLSLLRSVEATFIKHFSNSNRREGMKSLRPKAKKEKHSVTFFSGLCFGCAVALLIAIIISFCTHKLITEQEGASYMINIFPLYSFFAYTVLHMLVHVANIYFWRRYRINYPFIFGFKQGTELGHWEVFLLNNGLSVFAMASFLINLHLDMNYRTQNCKTLIQLIPLGLVTVVLLVIICPLDIIYRSSRFFFIRSIFRCFCAPLYQVTFTDIFLADQLTSQVQAIRCLELYVCYYGLGELDKRQKKCHSHGVYNIFYFVVAVVPYWLRFLQCVRRFCEERDSMHAYNGLRYFLTIVAVLTRTAYELKKGTKWMIMALISSAIATIMSIFWDIVVDWGLLQRHSQNVYLRDRLLLSRKSVYFTAMVLDILLRMSWIQLLLEFDVHSFQKIAITTIIPCLEILRRGIWSFFRLENEHANNVAKYRAFKSVPLPFQLPE